MIVARWFYNSGVESSLRPASFRLIILTEKNQFLSSTILNNANSRDHVLAIDFCTIRWATRLPFDFGTGSDFFPPIAFYRTIFLIASWNYCSYQISSSLFTTLLQSRRNRGILAIPRSPRTILINWRRYWFRVFVNFWRMNVSKNRFVFGRVDDKVTLIATPVWAVRLSVHDHVHVCLLWFRLDHVG
jgi:hypothetical protein